MVNMKFTTLRTSGDSLRRPLGHWSPARAIATLRDVATRPFPRAGRAWPARRISTETPGDETSQKPTIRRGSEWNWQGSLEWYCIVYLPISHYFT